MKCLQRLSQKLIYKAMGVNSDDTRRPKCQQVGYQMLNFLTLHLHYIFLSPNQRNWILSISETIVNLFFSCRRSQESLHSNKARWKYGQNTKQCSDWILIAFLFITAVIGPFFNSELGFDQKRKIVDIGVL